MDEVEHYKCVWDYYMQVVVVSSLVRMAEHPGLHLVVGFEEVEEAKKNKSVRMKLLSKTTVNI